MITVSPQTVMILFVDIVGIVILLFLTRRYCRRMRIHPILGFVASALLYLLFGGILSYITFMVGLSLNLPLISIYIASAIAVLIGSDLVHVVLNPKTPRPQRTQYSTKKGGK